MITSNSVCIVSDERAPHVSYRIPQSFDALHQTLNWTADQTQTFKAVTQASQTAEKEAAKSAFATDVFAQNAATWLWHPILGTLGNARPCPEDDTLL